MRANTIALRRIAEQNQRDAREVTRQAELTQKSSQSMAKIAYMSMIYLPANFIAVRGLFCFCVESRSSKANLGVTDMFRHAIP
jgi:hypothetical protein